ncbi:uncharacterized protein A1O5_08661 [Cladophialophora psammophila CBS 110553]|uniref:Heterokaryon incompatibility domain-containing protein n=1 Tax=Cladophialophora psammophila CBS 110553 TaxID=1182543 RepID=W9WTS1_9EURO|nr:uncharacterized protein A1O5_08661 [Cladophialophora psammophila CBS 110553]EXJ68046.1 hypothetical protein A1O5_08661 [Cladophialophora psammophila CBS 110553]
MFLNFAKAHMVVAWLGTPTDEDDFLFQYMSRNFSGSRDGKSKATDENLTGPFRAQAAAMKLITTKAFFQPSWTRVEYYAARTG